MTKAKIQWTEEQNTAVAKAALDMFGWKYSDWGVTTVGVGFNHAMRTVLPPHLFRNLQGGKSLVGVKKAVDKLRAGKDFPVDRLSLKAMAIPKPPKPRKSRATTAPVEEAPPELAQEMLKHANGTPSASALGVALTNALAGAPAPAMQALGAPVPQPAPQPGAAFVPRPDDSSITSQLSSVVADIMVEAIKKFLTNNDIAQIIHHIQLGQMPMAVVDKPATKHDPELEHTAKEVKTQILLCGFKPHQQNQFIQAFPHLQLKFWYSERPNEGLEVLKQKAQHVKAVMFTMEATSHSAVRTAEMIGKRVVRVTGGTSAMMSALRAFK